MSEFVLGTPEYPLIDIVHQGIDKKEYQPELGVRADASLPIHIATNVEPPVGVSLNDYAYGLYIRQLPVRSMLAAANDEIDKRNKADNNRQKTWASGFLGAPGTGKTFCFVNWGRITHQKGALLVDCSEKDAKTLFENPEFDSSSANREKAAIDVKIKYRNMQRADGLSDESLALLKSVAGAAVKEDENGRVSVDWSAVRFNGKTMHEHEYHMQVFQKTLNDICQKENISVTSDKSNIGIVMKDGELFRVFDPASPDYGRPVILDELNRAKFGTLDNLYGLLNFLNSPGVTQFKITGADNREIIIDKDKIPETFYLNFTGNQAIEGMGSQLFNDPFLSRVPEGFALKTIPDLTPADYADMICSYLMGGVPGVILRDAFNVKEDEAKQENFIDFLQKVREIGLTEQEKKDIPSWQKMNIANADKIIKLSERLGRFLYEVKELAHQRGTYLKMNNKPDIDPEYDAYLSKRMIDFRTVPYFFIEAEHMKAPVSNMSAFPSFKAQTNQNPPSDAQQEELLRYKTRGNNLEKVIADWLYMTFCPVDKGVRKIDETEVDRMYHAALELGYMNLIFRKNTLEARTNGETIADLYNVDISQTILGANMAHRSLRDALVAVLKNKYPELEDETNDSVLPISTLAAALNVLTDQKEAKQSNLLVFNENPDSVKANLIQPIADFKMPSKKMQENEQGTLISTENLLLSLSIHQLKNQNIERLFSLYEASFAESNKPASKKKSDSVKEDSFREIEEYAEKLFGMWQEEKSVQTGPIRAMFAKTTDLTTLKPVHLLLIYNQNKNKLLVAGNTVNPAVLKVFSSPNRMYIDRSSPSCQKNLARTVEQFLEDDIFGVEEMLMNKLLLENANDEMKKMAKKGYDIEQIIMFDKVSGALPLRAGGSSEGKRRVPTAKKTISSQGREGGRS